MLISLERKVTELSDDLRIKGKFRAKNNLRGRAIHKPCGFKLTSQENHYFH